MASLPLQESAVFILRVQHLTPSSAPQRLCAEQQLKGEARKHLEGKTYTKNLKKKKKKCIQNLSLSNWIWPVILPGDKLSQLWTRYKEKSVNEYRSQSHWEVWHGVFFINSGSDSLLSLLWLLTFSYLYEKRKYPSLLVKAFGLNSQKETSLT